MAESFTCAVLLLAGGSSARMGRPKQLLSVGGQPMLRRAVEAAAGSGGTPVIVVLGANATEIRPCLDGLAVHIVVNAGWEEGMGSSVRVGMKALGSILPNARGVIVALADQPQITARHLFRLMEVHQQTNRSIVASRSKGKLMPPVFFTARHFPSLRALRGDAGARSLLQGQPDEIAVVDSDELNDVDTPDDYAACLKKIIK